jgi:hypothetical protein
MQAAGPQGPLPASQETISSLERFTFDEKTLGELPAPPYSSHQPRASTRTAPCVWTTSRSATRR